MALRLDLMSRRAPFVFLKIILRCKGETEMQTKTAWWKESSSLFTFPETFFSDAPINKKLVLGSYESTPNTWNDEERSIELKTFEALIYEIVST